MLLNGSIGADKSVARVRIVDLWRFGEGVFGSAGSAEGVIVVFSPPSNVAVMRGAGRGGGGKRVNGELETVEVGDGKWVRWGVAGNPVVEPSVLVVVIPWGEPDDDEEVVEWRTQLLSNGVLGG